MPPKSVGLLSVADITTGSSNTVDAKDNGAYPFYDRSQVIKRSDKYLFDCEAVIVPGEGVDFIPRYASGKFDLHQRAYAVFPKESVNGKYLYYAILNNKNHFAQVATGSTVKSLRLKSFELMEIPFVDLDTQIKISKILSDLDDKIALNQAINDNLLIQCKAQYHQLLRKSESTVLLSDLAEVCYGKDHKSLNDGKIPVYGSGGVMRYAEKALYSGKESVLIPRKGSLNNIMYVCEPFWSVDTMFYTKMKNEWVGKYLYFFLAEYDLAGMNIGSAVPSMTTELLNAIEIPYPGDIVLKSFDHTIQPLFNQIWLNKKECTHLASIRDSILPKLLSGEIDISSLGESQLNNHLSQNQGESI